MMTIDEALDGITSATYTRWIEHRTESGNWSRRRHQETRHTITPEQITYLASHPLHGEKRTHIRNTPLPTRIVIEHDEHTRTVTIVEYHH